MSAADIPPPPPRGDAPLLPPDAGRDRPLFAVAAILVFLACLAALGARGAWRVTDGWTEDLRSAMTIQVLPQDGRDAEADALLAAEIAAATPGVASAAPRGREASEALLAPWLGEAGLPEDLPIPLLVTVRLDPSGDLTAVTLQTALREAGLDASVDDRRRFRDGLARIANVVKTLGLSLLALTAGAAAAVVAFASRASLAARLDMITALHLSGAEDSFIASLFQRRFFMLGLKAGAAGVTAAGAVYLLVFYGGSADEEMRYFLPGWVIAPFELVILLLSPFATGLIAALSARLAVAADLRERW